MCQDGELMRRIYSVSRVDKFFQVLFFFFLEIFTYLKIVNKLWARSRYRYSNNKATNL